jgi:SOS-response transcriptional repressor LexA
MAQQIGTYLYKTRKDKGAKGPWSLREVARRAGISDSYLSQLETGKVKRPLPEILRGLARVYRLPYEELLCRAGYLSSKKESSATVEIPLYEKLSSGSDPLCLDTPTKTITISRAFLGKRNCFALRVQGDYLKECGIAKKDIVVIAIEKSAGNGDIVMVRSKNTCAFKKLYRVSQDKKGEQIFLQPCAEGDHPVLLKNEGKDLEIIGRVIMALKIFNL